MLKNWTLVLFLAFLVFITSNAHSKDIGQNKTINYLRKSMWIYGVNKGADEKLTLDQATLWAHKKKTILPEELLIPISKELKKTE